jgi:DNA-binding response OmpR family regulator
MASATPPGGIPGLKAKALIVSDDPETARLWAVCVSQSGADVIVADHFERAFQIWLEENPEIILIESMTGSQAALELCQKLRQETPAPIVFLPSSDDESELYKVYKAGADDCLAPPVSPRLFMLKIKAWLRRCQVMPTEVLDDLQQGQFRLNPARRIAYSNGSGPIRLTTLETRLLFLLMSHPGRVLDSDFLVERVWGHYGNGDSVLLKNLIYRLRRKIEPDPACPSYLVTEANQGYKFQV